jgi:hypothetical protein
MIWMTLFSRCNLPVQRTMWHRGRCRISTISVIESFRSTGRWVSPAGHEALAGELRTHLGERVAASR